MLEFGVGVVQFWEPELSLVIYTTLKELGAWMCLLLEVWAWVVYVLDVEFVFGWDCYTCSLLSWAWVVHFVELGLCALSLVICTTLQELWAWVVDVLGWDYYTFSLLTWARVVHSVEPGAWVVHFLEFWVFVGVAYTLGVWAGVVFVRLWVSASSSCCYCCCKY